MRRSAKKARASAPNPGSKASNAPRTRRLGGRELALGAVHRDTEAERRRELVEEPRERVTSGQVLLVDDPLLGLGEGVRAELAQAVDPVPAVGERCGSDERSVTLVGPILDLELEERERVHHLHPRLAGSLGKPLRGLVLRIGGEEERGVEARPATALLDRLVLGDRDGELRRREARHPVAVAAGEVVGRASHLGEIRLESRIVGAGVEGGEVPRDAGGAGRATPCAGLGRARIDPARRSLHRTVEAEELNRRRMKLRMRAMQRSAASPGKLAKLCPTPGKTSSSASPPARRYAATKRSVIGSVTFSSSSGWAIQIGGRPAASPASTTRSALARAIVASSPKNISCDSMSRSGMKSGSRGGVGSRRRSRRLR